MTLKQLREAKRLSQEDVAGSLKITVSGYVKIETGRSRPRNATIKKLARFFVMSPDEMADLIAGG